MVDCDLRGSLGVQNEQRPAGGLLGAACVCRLGCSVLEHTDCGIEDTAQSVVVDDFHVFIHQDE